MVSLVSEFSAGLANLRTNLKLATAAKGGYDSNKSTKFEVMSKLAVKYARKGYTWATATGNADAAEVYDVVKSDFNSSSAFTIALASQIADRLNTDLKALVNYRITKANVDALLASITQAQAYTSEPAIKRKQGAEANRASRTIIKDLDNKLAQIEDLIVSEYEDDEITFVNLFLSAHHITNLGSRKTKLTVHVTDKAGQPIADALGDILEMDDEEQYSDENGDLTIIGIKNGNYTLKVSKDENSVTQKFTIKIGDQLKLKAVL